MKKIILPSFFTSIFIAAVMFMGLGFIYGTFDIGSWNVFFKAIVFAIWLIISFAITVFFYESRHE